MQGPQPDHLLEERDRLEDHNLAAEREREERVPSEVATDVDDEPARLGATAPRRLVPRVRQHRLEHELLAHPLHVSVVGVVREREWRVGAGGHRLEHLAERRGPPVARLGADQAERALAPRAQCLLGAGVVLGLAQGSLLHALRGVASGRGVAARAWLVYEGERRSVQRIAGRGVGRHSVGHRTFCAGKTSLSLKSTGGQYVRTSRATQGTWRHPGSLAWRLWTVLTARGTQN